MSNPGWEHVLGLSPDAVNTQMKPPHENNTALDIQNRCRLIQHNSVSVVHVVRMLTASGTKDLTKAICILKHHE